MKVDDINANRFVLDPKAATDLRAKLKDDPKAGLKQAAQQFEGMLLQMMLKSMRDASPQDGVLNNDQTRFYTSILDQQLAQNLSSKGTLGFAKLIEAQLGRSVGGGQSEGVFASLEEMNRLLLERQAASSAAGTTGRELRGVGAPANRAPVGPLGPGASGTPVGNNEFVNRIWPHAVDAANALGVQPHFLVAHAALETGWGKSEIRLPDGSTSYNLFGVKSGRSWQGASVEVQTTEYVNGVAETSRERFRVYGSYADAFRDYAALLQGSARFASVVGQQDGTQFARSLQQSGYATDPMYADKLGRIINGSTLRQALSG